MRHVFAQAASVTAAVCVVLAMAAPAAAQVEGSATGVVTVCVPHDRKSIAIDGGELFDSTR